MDRRKFLCSSTASLLIAADVAGAATVPRVAVIFNNAPSNVQGYPYYEAFVQGLHQRGLQEGRDLIVVVRSAEGRPDRLPKVIADLMASNPDVIVAVGPAAGAAFSANKTIPIVAVQVDDLYELGIASNYGRPGTNLTGLTGEVNWVETAGKRLQLLHEVAPSSSRIAILGYGLKKLNTSTNAFLETASRKLGCSIVWTHARAPGDLDDAFNNVRQQRADALYVEAAPVTYRYADDIIRFAAKWKLPAIYEFPEGPRQGGLMSYGSDLSDLMRRSAAFVAKMLNGVKPADLPIEQPTKFDTIVNVRTARALGLTIPQSIRVHADLI